MSETESEAKWCLDHDSWLKIQEKLPLIRQLDQKNEFFDSSNCELRDARWALRLRTENGKSFLAAKGPAEKCGKVVQRPEIETELNEQELNLFRKSSDLEDLPFRPCQFLFERFGNLALEPFLSFTNQRKVLKWEQELLELDYSECFGEKRYELEWEADAEHLNSHLVQLEAWLEQNKFKFVASEMGKLSWALEVKQKLNESSPQV